MPLNGPVEMHHFNPVHMPVYASFLVASLMSRVCIPIYCSQDQDRDMSYLGSQQKRLKKKVFVACEYERNMACHISLSFLGLPLIYGCDRCWPDKAICWESWCCVFLYCLIPQIKIIIMHTGKTLQHAAHLSM
jgi:hypothetical protein